MSETGDLFDYPYTPGAKERGGTSEKAAKATAARAGTLRARALDILAEAWPGGLSADQVAAICGVAILAMRPRITELFRMGFIEKTDRVARNASGHAARIWRFVP